MIKYPPFLVTAFANRMSEPNPQAAESPTNDQATRPRRDIGPIGTAARIILGFIFFGSVFYGHIIKGPFRPLPWVIGLLLFPAIFLIWQYLRTRHIRLGLRQTVLSLLSSMSSSFSPSFSPFSTPLRLIS